MKKFYFLTLALICAIVTNAADVYLRGEHNGWGTGDDWKFTQNGTTWTLEVPAADMSGKSFKIASEDWSTVNLGNGNTGLQLGTTYNLTNGGDNMKLASVGDWSMLRFTVTNSSKLLIEGFNGEVTYPETLFAIGTLSVGSWDPSKCVELNKTGNGVFEGTFTIVNSGDGYGYFGFVVNKGADSNDWSINANRYGSKAGNNTTVELGDESELTKTENVWRAKVTDNAGMVITVTVDLPNSKLTITGLVTGIEEIGIDDVPAVYYNLQGVKVANPENGIFIKRQGSKATKVVL